MSQNSAQKGQALAEGVLAMLVLASIWVAMAWLGHLQDMALSAQHASRHAAFVHTRTPGSVSRDTVLPFFQTAAHQWNERNGDPMLALPSWQVQLHLDRRTMLDPLAQVGGNDAMAASLRDNWGIQDQGIVDVSVQALPGVHSENATEETASVLGLGIFKHYPLLRRHTAILEGAGHASNDAQVQDIVVRSGLAWSDSASTSIALGKRINAVMENVDAPWRRAHAVFDWLGPWAGHVPAGHLADPIKEQP